MKTVEQLAALSLALVVAASCGTDASAPVAAAERGHAVRPDPAGDRASPDGADAGGPDRVSVESCETRTAMACFEARCRAGGEPGCDARADLLRAAAHAFMRQEDCADVAVVAERGEVTCLGSNKEQLALSASGLAAGAFTEPGADEALLAVFDMENRAHAQGWSYGQVMRWRDGAFVPAVELSRPYPRDPGGSEDSHGRSLEGDSLRVLAKLRDRDGRDLLLVCLSETHGGVIDERCRPFGIVDRDIGDFAIETVDDRGAAGEPGEPYRFAEVGPAVREKLDGDGYEDLVVYATVGRGVAAGDDDDFRLVDKTRETHQVRILFDGARMRLADPLPAALRQRSHPK